MYRAQWTIEPYTDLSYCPFVRVRNAGGAVVDQTYLLAQPNVPGGSTTNSWALYPQYLGNSPDGGGYALAAATVPNGSNVLVVYNSQWTQDVNEDGTQDSLEVAQYYAQRRGVPTSHLIGCPVGYFNATGAWGRISYSNFYHDILTPVAAAVTSCTDEIYYLAVCYGIPVYADQTVAGRGTSLDANLIDLFRNRVAFNGTNSTDSGTTHAFALSSSNPRRSRTLRALRAASPTNFNIFLPSRVDGPDPEIAKGLVDKALYAEAHLRDGGGTPGQTYSGIAMTDDCYDNTGKGPLWKSVEVGRDVKNIFAAKPTWDYASPLTRPGFNPGRGTFCRTTRTGSWGPRNRRPSASSPTSRRRM